MVGAFPEDHRPPADDMPIGTVEPLSTPIPLDSPQRSAPVPLDPEDPLNGPVLLPVGRGPPVQWDMRSASLAISEGRVTPDLEDWLRSTATYDGPSVEIYTAEQLISSGRWTEQAAAAQEVKSTWKYAEDTEGTASMYINTSLCTDGILGMLVHLHHTLVMGRGIRIELEPIGAVKEGESPREALGDRERDVEACLNAAARHTGGVHGGAMCPTLNEAVSRLNKMTMVHNRGAIIFHKGPAPEFEWKGKAIKDVPRGLELVHPMDLGMVALDDRGLPVRVWRNDMYGGTLDPSQCIYLWNADEGAQVHNSAGFWRGPVHAGHCVRAHRGQVGQRGLSCRVSHRVDRRAADHIRHARRALAAPPGGPPVAGVQLYRRRPHGPGRGP